MCNKLLVVTGIVAIFIVTVSCLSFAKDAPLAEQHNTINARAGKELVIVLESNRTTGYQWQLTKAVDKNLLLLVGLKYTTNQTKRIGSGGKEEWVFRALKSGSTKVNFQYVRPWEKKEPAAKTRTFTVIIK